MTIALLFSFPAHAQDITTGLVGRWKFDEGTGTTAADSAGSNNGTLTNGPTWTTGRIGGALLFDGSDDSVLVPTIDFTSANVTLSAWINVAGMDGCDAVMMFMADPGNTDIKTGINAEACGGTGKIGYHYNERGPVGGGFYSPAGAPAIPTNEWVLLVLSGTPSGATLYVYSASGQNSYFDAQTFGSPRLQNLAIGSDFNAGRLIDGKIDDVRVYNRALTAADVAALYAYAQPFTGPMTCDGAHAGVLIYNHDLHQMQYCNATRWVSMGREGVGSTSTVAADYTEYNGSCYSVRAPSSPLAENYSDWDNGQPDNPGAGVEDCAGFYFGSGNWHNFPCSQINYYACEKAKGAGCPADYDEYNNQCYKVFAETSTSTGSLHAHWTPNEPNGGTGENCAYLGKWDAGDPGSWIDSDCNSNGNIDGYICQKPFGGGCTGGYSANGGQCYKYTAAVVDWDAARTACQGDGGDLALDKSASTHTFLTSLFSPSTENAWIGLTDSVTEGEWKWVDGTDTISPKTWSDARAICQADGGDLAVAKDSGTNTFIKSKFDEGVDSVYLGATDTAVDQEWRWLDGTIIASSYLTWDEARTACQNEGGDLAKVPDAGTDTFLRTLYTPGSNTLWIGANDTAIDGTWVWTDASPATYTAWAGGEPNGGAIENCAFMLNSNNGDWHDAPCGWRAHYVCELPLGSGCPTTSGETLGGGTGACTNPAGVPGEVDYNTAEGVLQYCNGDNWIAIGPKSSGAGAPSSGLIHHWKLDTAAPLADSTGAATCTGGGSQTSGQIGEARSFTTSVTLDCGVLGTIGGLTTMTVSALIKRSAAGGGLFIGPNFPQDNGFSISVDSAGDIYFTVGGAVAGWDEGSVASNDTSWHLATLVFDGAQTGNANRLKGYIDGAPATLSFTGTIPASVTASANPLWIGEPFGAPNAGDIDDVRIYNRALSAAEVTQLYSATGGAVDITSNLAAHWRLDETTGASIADSIGTSTGTWADGTGNSVAEETTAGQVATAIDFDGADDAIAVGTPAALNNIFVGGGSLAAWVYVDAYNPSGSRLFDKNNALMGWHFTITSTGKLYTGRIFNVTAGDWETAAGIVPLGAWTHVAMTYDEGSTANDPVFYVNGAAVSATEIGTPSGTVQDDSTGLLYIGNRQALNRALNGKLDDVRIYTRALSATDIAALYNNGTARCTSPAGVAGEIVYNADNTIMQYCNGTEWIGIGDAP